MKKLIIAATIVCVACFAQAASIKWGGDIAAANGVDPVSAGSVAYLIHGTTAAEAAVSTIYVDGADWSAWTTDTGATIVKSYTLSALEAESSFRFEASKSITGASDAGYYSVVVVDGSAGDVGLTGSYNYAGQNSLVDPTSGATTDLTIGDNWSGSAPFIGQGGYDAVNFAAAPEPTSGLLLLIGIAGLALRRRRA